MHYRILYDKEEMHNAIRGLEATIQSANLTPTGAALRWIFYHSVLGERDGVIMGGSKPKYIEHNMADIAEGPLPAAVWEKMDAVWKMVENVAPTM